MDTEPFNPLAGVRVLDLSQNLAGPYGTQILGDLGADVIKIEPPGGDPARRWGPPFIAGESPLFLAANRNKRSFEVDLKSATGHNTVMALAKEADVFVEAFRRGVAERLGLGPKHLRSLNPELVYVSVSAYGAEGPLAGQPGYDPLLQAYSGIMDITGNVDGPPARAGVSIIDLGTGTWVALSVLAALRNRDREGRGTLVETSLLDTALALMSYHLTSAVATGEAPSRMGSGLAMIAPYGAYPTQDGFVMIAAANDRLFLRLDEALSLGLGADERYRTNPSRVANRLTLDEFVREATRPLTRGDLLARLQEYRVPASPIHEVQEVISDDQVTASGMLRSMSLPDMAEYVDVPTPVLWEGERAPMRRPPPVEGLGASDVCPEWLPRAT